MQIILVGLNHQTAPVAIREQFSLADCGLRMTLEDLNLARPANGRPKTATAQLFEVVILSTCNRLEVYAVAGDDPVAGWGEIEGFLAGLHGIALEDFRPNLYYKAGTEVVKHLMRVAAGLESMILGEPQILGQVSAAHDEAQAAGVSGPLLSHLFDRAARAGKRARTESDIGRHTTSISHAAADLIGDKLGDLDQVQALFVGAGEMTEVAAHALRDRGLERMNFINRTHVRAEKMASQFEGQALSWYHLPAALSQADVVLTATGAPHILIHESEVLEALPARNGRPLLFVDIAVPRDVEESVGELPRVKRFDIDDLQSTVDHNLAQRQAAIPDVEGIIATEAQIFEEWLLGRQVLPVLVELRNQARRIAETELERYAYHLEALEDEHRQAVSQMVHRIVNKLLHQPTVRLKASAAEGNGLEYAQAVRDLFDLDVKPVKGQAPSNGHARGEGEEKELLARVV